MRNLFAVVATCLVVGTSGHAAGPIRPRPDALTAPDPTSGTDAMTQLAPHSESAVVYGHHHLNVPSIVEAKRFWVGVLGGTPAKLGALEVVKFPHVLVILTERVPSGGSKGTTVNHVGFLVPNLRKVLDEVKKAGFALITAAELPATWEVKEDIALSPATNSRIAFAMAPGEVKVELTEEPSQTAPIANHHVHFYTDKVDAMKAWYVKTFSAKGGMRGTFQAADLPGVNLTFSDAAEPPAGTRGRSLDHIGFEVRNLEAFCKQLEGAGVKFDRPYTVVPALGISIAFFTDPFGTYIELTEGLGKM
ncbi:MAG: VOC family protein [Acidobacteriota bacterium]